MYKKFTKLAGNRQRQLDAKCFAAHCAIVTIYNFTKKENENHSNSLPAKFSCRFGIDYFCEGFRFVYPWISNFCYLICTGRRHSLARLYALIIGTLCVSEKLKTLISNLFIWVKYLNVDFILTFIRNINVYPAPYFFLRALSIAWFHCGAMAPTSAIAAQLSKRKHFLITSLLMPNFVGSF